MNKKALEALEKSIAHWQDNLDNAKTGHYEDVSTGWRDCALCVEFAQTNGEWTCSGCPVADKTGETGCKNTPYEEVVFQIDTAATHKEVITAIEAELAFLKSLLPTETEK